MLPNAKIVIVVSIDKKLLCTINKMISCNILPCDPSYATSIAIHTQYITTHTIVHH
jgi:hypothetical protein